MQGLIDIERVSPEMYAQIEVATASILLRGLTDVLLSAEHLKALASPEFNLILSEAERMRIRGIIHRSSLGSAKYEGAVKALGNSRLRIDPKIISVEPEYDEKIYQRHFFVADAADIAATKAGWDSGYDARKDRFKHLESTITYLKSLGMEENRMGSQFYSLASDVVATELNDRGEVISLVHKPEGIRNRDDAFESLRRLRGSKRQDRTFITGEDGQEIPVMYLGYQNGLASFELISQTGAVSQREIKTVQLEASDDFLLALVYGFNHPKVSKQMRLMFSYIYQMHMENGLQADLCGYDPNVGLPMDKLRKVNAGWKDDCAFIAHLLILEIDGIPQEQSTAFGQKLAELREICRGYPADLQVLLQRHSQLLTLAEENPAAAAKYKRGDQRLRNVLNRQVAPDKKRLLVGDWYDLSQEVQISPLAYYQAVMNHILVA